MLLSPMQATASKILGEWKVVWPRVTQEFGESPQMYEQFEMKGHNGIDYGSNGDKNIFAPMSGKCTVKHDEGGYGLHIRIKDSTKEVVLGHLAKAYITDGQYIHMGDKVGVMGGTGFSTGIHLHYGLRFLKDGKVKDYDNGYFGYVDPAKYTLRWKGSLLESTIS